MKRLVITIAIAAGLCLFVFRGHSLAARADTEKAALRVDLERYDSSLFSSSGFISGRSVKDGEALPPQLVSENPVAFDIFPSTPAVFADEPEGTGKEYSVIWVDLDADGTFSDDEKVTLEGSEFTFVRIVEEGGRRRNVEFSGFLIILPDRSFSNIYLQTNEVFAGTLSLGDKQVTLALSDANGNGTLIDYDWRTLSKIGAMISVLSEDKKTVEYWFPLAQTVALRNRFYEPQIQFAGKPDNASIQLTLAPRTLTTETVRITGSGVTSVLLTGKDSAFRLIPSGDQLQVPEGNWNVRAVSVSEGGHRYAAIWSDLEKTIPFVVTAGAVTDLVVGGPLNPTVTIENHWMKNNVSLSLPPAEGIGGGEYSPAAGRPDRSWSVTRLGGSRVVASGTFEYG